MTKEGGARRWVEREPTHSPKRHVQRVDGMTRRTRTAT